jgi:hypothetical protein
MSQVLAHAEGWLGIVLTAACCALAWGALATRAMFVMCVRLAASAALATAALLAFNAAPGALGLALVGAALGPVLLLAGVSLSAQTSKLRVSLWFTAAPAAFIVAAIIWIAAGELGAPAPAMVATPVSGLWLAALAFVAAAACAALLGYGERGVLERNRRGER